MSNPLDVRATRALVGIVLAIGAFGALASISLPSTTSADAVGPPPASCPEFSTPQSSHAGPLCVPLADCSVSACSGDSTCDDTPLWQCIETRDCGGRRPPDSGPCTVEHVTAECAGERDVCAVGVCRDRRVCRNFSIREGGCGCRAAGAAGRSAPLSLAAMTLIAIGCAAARRRTRSR